MNRWLLGFVVIGLLVRFALAAVCWGTNDANTFGQFGFFITRDGLIETYIHDTWLNHPPIPAYWCAAAWRLTVPFVTSDGRLYSAHLTWDTPGRYFSAVFKIPSLLSDCLTVCLLYRLWRGRVGPTRAMAVAAGYAWSLDAILVSGYHCNTDSVYAFLCLLCAYLIQDKRWHFWGGLALGAAINVKLTPVLLVLPLLLCYRRWGGAARFLAGLSIGVIPFLPVLKFAGAAFYANAIAYKSNADNWGITYLLMQHGKPPGALNLIEPGDCPWATFYFEHGRPVVLALIGLWAVAARVLRRWDSYEVAAVTLAIFLVFTPGFGVQYTVMVLPLLFAARPGLANAYGIVAGLFLLVVYWAQWPGRWPPDSQFKGMFPWPSPLYGLAAWGVLGYFLVRTLAARNTVAAIIPPRGEANELRPLETAP